MNRHVFSIVYLDRLKPQEKKYRVYDERLRNLSCEILPGGTKTLWVTLKIAGRQYNRNLGHWKGDENITRLRARAERSAVELRAMATTNPITMKAKAQNYTLQEFLKNEYLDMCREENLVNGGRDLKATIECGFPALLNRPLTKITDWDLRQWLRLAAKNPSKKTGKPLSPRSRAYYAQTLRAALQRAVSEKLLSSNPFSSLPKGWKPKPVAKREPKSLDGAELKRFESALRERNSQLVSKQRALCKRLVTAGLPAPTPLISNQYADYVLPIFSVMLYSGLRSKEARQLCWSHVHLDSRELRLPGDITKNREARISPITDQLFDILSVWRGQSEGELCFPSPVTGQVLDNFKSVWRTLHKNARLRKVITPHSLRHTFTTFALTRGVPQMVVQKWRGDKDSSTMSVYSHVHAETHLLGIEKLSANV